MLAERGRAHIFDTLDMRRTEHADANAALTDAAHNVTLDNMLMLFADVMTTEEVLAAVHRAR